MRVPEGTRGILLKGCPPAGDSDWVLCVCEKKKSGWGMVAQWWGALPPKPPGMSAANQAASVVIDVSA